jgi:hypothetical protein
MNFQQLPNYDDGSLNANTFIISDNLRFSVMFSSNFSFFNENHSAAGASPPDPHFRGLCPWISLEDYHPPDLLICPPTSRSLATPLLVMHT